MDGDLQRMLSSQGKGSEAAWLHKLFSCPPTLPDAPAGGSADKEGSLALSSLSKQGWENGDNLHCVVDSFLQVGVHGMPPFAEEVGLWGCMHARAGLGERGEICNT